MRKFDCAAYVPISPPQHTTMGPHRKLGIYIGYISPSIIKYLEPLTGDLFTARYADCIFDENHFSALGGDLKHHIKECLEIDWNVQGIPTSDSRTNETKLQVQKIIDSQHIVINLPDAFTDYKGVCWRILWSTKIHPQANGYRYSFHPGVFQGIEIYREQ